MNIELFTNKEIIHYTSLDEVQQEKEIDLIAVILMCKSFMDDSLEKDRFNDLELRLCLDIEESNRITESYASAKEAELEAEAKKRRERITIEEFELIPWSTIYKIREKLMTMHPHSLVQGLGERRRSAQVAAEELCGSAERTIQAELCLSIQEQFERIFELSCNEIDRLEAIRESANLELMRWCCRSCWCWCCRSCWCWCWCCRSCWCCCC